MTNSPIQESIQQLSQLIQTLVNGQAAGSPPKLPKVAAPSPYNGDWTKLDEFLGQCKLYLALKHADYPDDI